MFRAKRSSQAKKITSAAPKPKPKNQLQLEPLESRDVPNVGGGYTNHGIDGIYYSDPNFSTQAFTRKDVRVDFDWGTTIKPGGSISPGFQSVGTDNYSARWTGQIITKFSETYTFSGYADDTFVLEVKPAGSSTWTTVVNKTQNGGMNFAGFYNFQAGQAYDVRMSFQEFSGSAAVRLLWTSHSTPTEVIDPLDQAGLNNPEGTIAFVDIVKGARNNWETSAGMDSNGWPMGDARYYFQESLNQGLGLDPLMRGTIHFSFVGKASVDVRGNVDLSSLAYSYNSTTNTTTGTFNTKDLGSNASYITLSNSHRNGQANGPGGFTDLKLLRPVTPDATGAYPTGAIFTTNIKDYIEHFTVIRFQYVANMQQNWNDRTLPSFFNQMYGSTTVSPWPILGTSQTSNNLWSWEYEVMLANETGSDLMLSIPVLATGRTIADVSSYVYKLANLIRYGSDGVNPYTAPTANPIYPPLNPNLRVYLELENELWNFAGGFYNDYYNINQLVTNALLANNSDFQAINYDGLSTAQDGSGNYVNMSTWRLRYPILRMKQISDIFRGVFGDAAMPGNGTPDARIRPLYEWQYNNENDTAKIALTWADRYFNKSDPASTYSGPAHPINYFLWGGGGATYYSANNSNGLTDLLANPGFETPAVPAGYSQAPTGATWTFSGTSGIARDGGSADDIPTPFNGSQVGYIAGTGRITNTFTVSANQVSNLYAVSFKAHNRKQVGATAADTQNLRVYLDYGTANQIDITASTFSQGNGYTPPDIGSITPWAARNVFWTDSQYYYTKTVPLAAGSTHTVTIVGTAAATQIAFLEDVRVTSVDAIFAGGIPGGGEATGQPAGQNIRTSMNGSVSWAAAFGLNHLAYEGGWSLGGDDGGSYVQLKAKYGDARTLNAQANFMDYYDQAGGAVDVFGTYSQTPSWSDYYAEQGMINPGNYPIIQGIDQRANRLGAAPTNGIAVPAVLTSTSVTLGDRSDPQSATINSVGGWLTWNIVVSRSGNYSIKTVTQTGGSLVVLSDENSVVTGTSGGELAGTVYLSAGLHAIKVRSTAGSVTVNSITVVGQGAPVAPVIASLTSRNDSVTVNWNPVSGVTGYYLLMGTAPGNYTTRINVGGATSKTVNGLINNTTYYFAVSSYSSDQTESLPSSPRSTAILVEGQTGRLANWEFTGLVSSGATAPPNAAASGAASGLSVSTLTRGPGLLPASSWVSQFFPDRFASEAVGNTWGQNLASAVSLKQYYQFTASANSGIVFSLSELNLQMWFSDSGNANNQVAIQYSTDGVTFTNLSYSGTINNTAGLTSTLSGIQSLQNFSGTVTFRIYTFGSGVYTATGIGLGTASDDLAVRGNLKSTPTVDTVVIGDGTAQRSMVSRLTVAFNTFVTLGANAFTVTPQSGGTAVPVTWTTADVDGRTVATLQFQTGSISDGLWRLTTNAASVTHRAGGLVMQTNRSDNFFRIFGDINGDSVVNGTDLFQLRSALSSSIGQANYLSAFDFDSDGVVNGTDFFQFRSRFGTQV